jgi:hypothetical protein
MTEQQIKESQGLTNSEAKQLQEKFGKNELVAKRFIISPYYSTSRWNSKNN